MKFSEIFEQIPTTLTPTIGMTGNTAILDDPKLKAAQAAQLAAAKKEREEKKKAIQDQIQQLQQQLSDLNKVQ